MKKAILLISLFFSLSLILEIGYVHGADNGTDLNLSSFPQALADKLSISAFAGGIIASLILLLMFTLPVALFSKGNLILVLFVGFATFGACVALTWLPFWFLIIIVFVVAVLFSQKIGKMISGEG